MSRRPSALQDGNRDSDEEDPRDRDYDVATLANNLSQAFRYDIYTNDDVEVFSLPMLTSFFVVYLNTLPRLFCRGMVS